MSWPLSHEFNEAIQSPKATMSDPDLRAAEVVVGATGLPLPRSGNFADVYQFRAPDGREWAVKCFTRPVVGLAERYAKLSEALAAAELPFAVGFEFLAEGIRVGGAWRPVLKMEWVEGLLLNQLVRDNTSSQKVLGALVQMWSRLCKRLRETGFAHADVQHGNVLLVPGARAGAYGLKLIDYDGMWVKALANNPSGEVGHPSYQHPDRARTRAYSPDLDRFPHLAIATALRGLLALGPGLWDRYDNGDNLLFGEADFRAPAASPLMRELWDAGDAGLRALVGRLAVACGKPIPQTPWLDQIAPEGDPLPLSDAEHRAALEALGLPLPVPVPVPVPVPLPPEPAAPAWVEVPPPAVVSDVELVEVEVVPAPRVPAFEALDADDERPARPPRDRKKGGASKKKQQASRLPLYIGGGVAAVLALVVAVVLLKGGSKPPEVAEEPKEPPVAGPIDPAPKDPPPKKVEPKEAPKVEPKTPNPGTGAEPKQPDRPTRLTVREAWSFDLPENFPVPRVLFTGDSKLVIVASNRGEVILLDAATGKVVPTPLTNVYRPTGAKALSDSFALVYTKPGSVAFADFRTGELVPVTNSGPADAEYRNVSPEVTASPNRKYVALGYAIPRKSALCSIEFANGKVIRSLDWHRGSVHFTADSSRVLVADRTGRCQWFKLPSGEPDGEWALEPARDDPTVGGLRGGSTDGSLFIYDGALAGHSGTHHVIDGRTGAVLRSLSGYATQFHTLTTDGALGMFPKRNNAGHLFSATVVHLPTGTEVAELSAPAPGTNIVPQVQPNGRGAVALVGSPLKVVYYAFEPARTAIPEPKQPSQPGIDRYSVPALWTRKLDLTFTRPALAFNETANALHVWGANISATFALSDGARRDEFDLLAETDSVILPLSDMLLQRAKPNSKTVDVFGARGGKPKSELVVPELPGPTVGGDEVRAVLSLDQRYLAVARSPIRSTDRQLPVQVYDRGNLAWKESWTGGTVRFAPDNKRAVLAEVAGRVRWYRLPNGTADGEWKTERTTQYEVQPVVAPDCSTVCIYTANETWTLFDAESGKVRATFRGTSPIGPPAYSGDSKRLAIINMRQQVAQVASTTDGKVVASISKLTSPIMALSHDGRRLALHDHGNSQVALFDLALAPPEPTQQPTPTVPGADRIAPLRGAPVELASKWKADTGALKPDRVALVSGANVLALGSLDGFTTLDLAKGETRTGGFLTLRSAPSVELIALDGGMLASLAPKATEFRIWNAKSGSPNAATARFPELPPGAGEVRVAISPDGKWVAAARLGAPNGPFRVADALAPNKPIVSGTWKGGTIHFTPDRTRVLFAEEDPKDLRVSCQGHWFVLPSGKNDGDLKLPAGARVDTLSANGKRLVIAMPEHTTPYWRRYVLNGETGKPVLPLPLDYSHRHPVALSPDGKRLAAIRTAGPGAPAVELIDVDTGTRVATATLEAAEVSAVELAPDGKSLYVVSQKAGAVWAFTVPAAAKP